jgi:hypothetical protein
MEIFIHGLYNEYNVIYKTPGLPSSIITDVELAIQIDDTLGKDAYSLVFVKQGYVFTKYKTVKENEEAGNPMGYVAVSLFLPFSQKPEGEQIINILNDLLQEIKVDISDNKLNVLSKDWTFVEQTLFKHQTFNSGGTASNVNCIYYKDESELKKYFDFSTMPEYGNNKQLFLIEKEVEVEIEDLLEEDVKDDDNASLIYKIENSLGYKIDDSLEDKVDERTSEQVNELVSSEQVNELVSSEQVDERTSNKQVDELASSEQVDDNIEDEDILEDNIEDLIEDNIEIIEDEPEDMLEDINELCDIPLDDKILETGLNVSESNSIDEQTPTKTSKMNTVEEDKKDNNLHYINFKAGKHGKLTGKNNDKTFGPYKSKREAIGVRASGFDIGKKSDSGYVFDKWIISSNNSKGVYTHTYTAVFKPMLKRHNKWIYGLAALIILFLISFAVIELLENIKEPQNIDLEKDDSSDVKENSHSKFLEIKMNESDSVKSQLSDTTLNEDNVKKYEEEVDMYLKQHELIYNNLVSYDKRLLNNDLKQRLEYAIIFRKNFDNNVDMDTMVELYNEIKNNNHLIIVKKDVWYKVMMNLLTRYDPNYATMYKYKIKGRSSTSLIDFEKFYEEQIRNNEIEEIEE